MDGWGFKLFFFDLNVLTNAFCADSSNADMLAAPATLCRPDTHAVSHGSRTAE